MHFHGGDMSSIFNDLIGSMQEDFGRRPSSLHAVLKSQPNLSAPLNPPAQTVALDSVVRRHEWGGSSHDWNCGELRGWHHEHDTYNSFNVGREDLRTFGSCNVTEGWECDIQDVVGLANSKSVLANFDTLDRMIETDFPELITPITADKLRTNLAHDEIRILNREKTTDCFYRHLWDGRVFLVNGGGSRHFAAARYIAARLGTPVPLRGTLRTYAINEMAVASLQRDFEMFVIDDSPNGGRAFHDAMKRFRAAYLWRSLPRPYLERIAIFLPRRDARSMKVSAVLREAGFFDFGLYLRSLASCRRN